MDLIVFLLLICVLVYFSIFLLHLLLYTRKIDTKLKNYYYGIAFFLVMFLIARTIFLVNDVIYDETGDLFFYTGPPYIIGNFFATLATFGIMLVVEKYVYTKLHFVPSVIVFICAVLTLVLPVIGDFNMINIYSIIAAIIGGLIPILYLIVGFQVKGQPGRKSTLLGIGLIIFMVGLLMYIDTLQEEIQIFVLLSPILTITGLGLFHYGLLFYGTS